MYKEQGHVVENNMRNHALCFTCMKNYFQCLHSDNFTATYIYIYIYYIRFQFQSLAFEAIACRCIVADVTIRRSTYYNRYIISLKFAFTVLLLERVPNFHFVCRHRMLYKIFLLKAELSLTIDMQC